MHTDVVGVLSGLWVAMGHGAPTDLGLALHWSSGLDQLSSGFG